MTEEHQKQARDAARALMQRFNIRLMSLKDAEAAALEGLWKAAQRFDAARGFQFWSFAKHVVHGAVWDEVRRHGVLTRTQMAAIRAQQQLEEEARAACPAAAPQQPAERAAARHTTTLALMHWIRATADAHAIAADADTVPSQAHHDPESAAIITDRNKHVRSAVSELPERQRHIIEQHYFREQQFADVAAALGKDKSTISRQLQDAHRALHAALVDHDLA